MSKRAQDRCKVCRRPVPDAVFVTRDGEPSPTSFVFASTGSDTFAFCNLCFESQRFETLTSEEIAALSQLFASLLSDG